MAVTTEDKTFGQMLTKRAADRLDEAQALEADVPRQPNDPEKKE